MSRDISALNQAEIDAAHLHEVVLVKLEFDSPVYVHSGIGSISYGGNTYLGVGGLGSISSLGETEALGPQGVQLTLDGTEAGYITEALDAGNYGDKVTIYMGYRQDDGTLVDDPWVAWKGWLEYTSLDLDDESIVSLTCQHDLTVLKEKAGDRYSDEDQQEKYPGDIAFQFTTRMVNLKLLWAGGSGGGGGEWYEPPGTVRE